MKTAIIIPARYQSTRLPGKPLVDICGKPMIQHVYEKALLVSGVDRVVVATDDQRVFEAVFAFDGEAIMTSGDHESGTDRLCEVAKTVDADLYVNLQGDEPLVRPADIERLILLLQLDAGVDCGTLCHAISSEEADDPNAVKVVRDTFDNAMYFSRAKIPCPRDENDDSSAYLKHVGVYAYRKKVLDAYSSLPIPAAERIERLEQLRLLYAGLRIMVAQVDPTGPGVDTPSCLEKVRSILRGVSV